MFNNIVYFIIVLLLFNLHNPDPALDHEAGYGLLSLMIGWIFFSLCCRVSFHRLTARYGMDGDVQGRYSHEYHGIVLRLSVLAICVFALDIFVFELKAWIQMIPGLKTFSVLQGIVALSVFFLYLSTLWYFAHRAYLGAFKARISRREFILSNIKLNMPILFPWVALSFVYDLITLSRWSGLENFLNRPEGQIPFFALFLIVLMVFMPRFLQYWWGCKPLETSERVRELDIFLRTHGLKYRALLRWPIFEGRIMTAGIMGIIPRYRYILVTDALMEILSVDELKAVLAHEIGHAKYRHMIFYIIFFVGYLFLSFGLFDIVIAFLSMQPFFMKALQSGETKAANLFSLAISVPVLMSILIYFRFVMGFFMRHFERQADLYSAVVMGSPRQTIRSLEKIALLSGRIRSLPSWHHFSIGQRVDYLWRLLREPELIKRHNRFIAFSLGLYLMAVIGLGYLANFSPLKKDFTGGYFIKVLNQQIKEEPDNPLLYRNLAQVYHGMGRDREAIKAYEMIIALDPDHSAAAMNNLAWLLVTTTEIGLRDRERALVLARKAVNLERSPIFLDTLAESLYVNGLTAEAIHTIQEAMALARENQDYYKGQLEKFKIGYGSMKGESQKNHD